MDFIYEIRSLKKQIEQFEKKLNAVIVELNKTTKGYNIATYSTDDDDNIKYPNDSDYD
jgi:hypothetical protein